MSSENLRQNADGTLSVSNGADTVPDLVIGGPAVPSATQPRFYAARCAKVPLTAGTDTAGGVLSFQNTLGFDILIEKLIIDITTVASAANTLSAGTTAASGTTLSANLIDTLDVRSATGTFDNVQDKSTNGKSRGKVANGKWLTISTQSGASAGLVGNAYIHFTPV